MRQRCPQDNWDEVLAEVRRTIDRWFFWVSVTGLIYIEPRRRTFHMTDLADIVNRLSVVCDQSFEGLITFEFSGCPLASRQWNHVEKLLKDFAHRIGATMLPYREPGKAAAWVLLYRDVSQRRGVSAASL